jgi:cytochrome c2
VFRAAFLMLLAGLMVTPASAAVAGKAECLRCHKSHYQGSSCIRCHRGDGRSVRLAIAHRDLIRGRFSWFALPGSPPLQRGERLLENFACRRCHTWAGKGNSLASNLDRLPPDTATGKILDAIKSPALFMPDFKFDERQRTDLVNAILAGMLKVGRTDGETPQVVHFEKPARHKENVFEKQCGPCHKALTEAHGALGRGDIGPNLSGLFTEHYPPTLKNYGKWTADILKKWLKNPREIRPESQMRPVALKKDDSDRLLVILATKPQ